MRLWRSSKIRGKFGIAYSAKGIALKHIDGIIFFLEMVPKKTEFVRIKTFFKFTLSDAMRYALCTMPDDLIVVR